MEKTKNELQEWGESRETSWEVAQAIFEFAENDEKRANEIWEDGIYFDHFNEIKKRAIEINNREDECLWWGEERISTERDEMQEFTDFITDNYSAILNTIRGKSLCS